MRRPHVTHRGRPRGKQGGVVTGAILFLGSTTTMQMSEPRGSSIEHDERTRGSGLRTVKGTIPPDGVSAEARGIPRPGRTRQRPTSLISIGPDPSRRGRRKLVVMMRVPRERGGRGGRLHLETVASSSTELDDGVSRVPSFTGEPELSGPTRAVSATWSPQGRRRRRRTSRSLRATRRLGATAAMP